MAAPDSGSIQVEGDRTRLQSFHEQSISVMNAMMSREWDAQEEESEDEPTGQGGSVFGAIFILMNAIMGASILILPCSFGQIGIITAIIMELFVVFIGYVAHMILADAVDRYNGSNYQDLVGRMCGPTAQLLSQFGLILYFFTLACATHITMGDQAVKICELADGVMSGDDSHWYCNRQFLIPVGSMTLIFPLIWVRNISTFSYVSVFSVFAVFYIVAAIIIDYFKLDNYVPDEILMPDIGVLPIMQYLPVFTLGFQCHMTSVPLYYELHNRSVSKYTVVILVTSFLVFTCYALAGIFGLMTWGVDVQPDVLLDYSSKDGLMTIARGAISVSVIGSYPIFAFLGRGAVDDTIVQIAEKFNRRLERNTELRRVIILFVWHFLALTIAVLTSSFGTVLQLVGSIAALFMLFFPGYMAWIESRNGNWGYRVTGVVFMVMGVFTFIWTIVYTLYQVATGTS